MLTRCPACAQWYEADELALASDADPGATADRCPADGTAVRVPDRRPPPPPPPTRVDNAGFAVFSVWAFSSVIWVFVGLPLLIVAVVLSWATGNWLFAIAWVLMSALTLALGAALGGAGGSPTPAVTPSTQPAPTRCPACRQWYEAVELAHAAGAEPDAPADRCPIDGTILPVPEPRTPTPRDPTH